MELPIGQARELPYLTLFRPPKAGKILLVLLGEQLTAFATHWNGEREVLCRSELQQPCPLCGAGFEARHSVYALAMNYPGRRLGIAHFTAGAFRFSAELQEHARNCRGLAVEVVRLGGPRSGVSVQVKPKRFDQGELPHVGDWLRPAVVRLLSPEVKACSHHHGSMLSSVDASPGSSGPQESGTAAAIEQASQGRNEGCTNVDACIPSPVDSSPLVEGLAEGELPPQEQSDAAPPRTDKRVSQANVQRIANNLFRMGGPYDERN